MIESIYVSIVEDRHFSNYIFSYHFLHVLLGLHTPKITTGFYIIFCMETGSVVRDSGAIDEQKVSNPKFMAKQQLIL
jgi:hypothetical protein